MPTPILLLALLAGGDAAAAKPTSTPIVPSLTEALVAAPDAQGAPGMMDKRADSYQNPGSAPSRTGSRWAPGRTLVQGYFGVQYLSEADTGSGSVQPVEGGDDFESVPTLGGGGMYKLGGERFDWGLEGMLAFGGRANATAFYAGGGGAAVAVDVDLLLFDLYGGPFVSMSLGERMRLYGAAGGLLQWASWDQDGVTTIDSGDGDGFGSGVYARTGLEFLINPGMLLGFGVRWSDSRVDLSGNLGNLDLEGVQAVVTVSRWL
jgi:hypothetical protein